MNTAMLLDPGHLPVWLLIAGLFLPRLSLFLAFWVGAYPPNPLPDLVNFVGWLLVPRFLMAYYISMDIGIYNLWFWAYIAIGLAGFFGETGYVGRRITRRTTVTRGDGTTTTTVEEEEV